MEVPRRRPKDSAQVHWTLGGDGVGERDYMICMHILEIVKGSGLLDHSIEQIIHMECCTRIQGIIVFGLQPSVRDYPALRDLENEP